MPAKIIVCKEPPAVKIYKIFNKAMLTKEDYDGASFYLSIYCTWSRTNKCGNKIYKSNVYILIYDVDNQLFYIIAIFKKLRNGI